MTHTVYTIAEELHAVVEDAIDDLQFSALVDAIAAHRGVAVAA
jgi:hypothetical protein